MSELKYCPGCGSELLPGDRFCGECGYDTQTATNTGQSSQTNQPGAHNPSMVTETMSVQQQTSARPAQPQRSDQPPGVQPSNRRAVIILISVLLLVFLGGGGIYWWLNQGGDQPGPGKPQSGQQEAGTDPAATAPSSTEKPDLSRASTYLPEPGLKCSFYANYPDGTSGPVERYTARIVPNEAVRASDADIAIDNGEEYGGGTHYVERPDGIYLVYDSVPMEISPLLKNNLTVGMSWDYASEYGSTVWTVIDMGVTLDLGFAKLADCLLLKEDNQAVGYQSIVYYAPGMGKVMEKYPDGGEVLTLTAFTKIDLSQAAEKVKQWSPNYQMIQDDRTQS